MREHQQRSGGMAQELIDKLRNYTMDTTMDPEVNAG
jgi:hypothetical protein